MRIEPRLNIVTLGMADVEKARKFYDGLGWKASPACQSDIVFFSSARWFWRCTPAARAAKSSNRRKMSFGAGTAAISRIWMATYGRSHGTRTSS